MRRVAVANATRCDPPLDTGEVATIVANAWRSEVQGFAKLPHAVLDSDAFRALPDAGKVAILALCRNHNGANNGRIALTRTDAVRWRLDKRSEEHTSELQSLMRISYAVFCLTNKKNHKTTN